MSGPTHFHGERIARALEALAQARGDGRPSVVGGILAAGADADGQAERLALIEARLHELEPLVRDLEAAELGRVDLAAEVEQLRARVDSLVAVERWRRRLISELRLSMPFVMPDTPEGILLRLVEVLASVPP